MTTDISAYMALPYTKVLKRDEDGDFVACVSELPGCSAHGATEVEALEFLSEVMTAWIEERLAAGYDVPRPSEEEDLPSGKWVQRVSRSLHQGLISLAKSEGVSLNQLAATILAEATGRRRAIPMQFTLSGPVVTTGHITDDAMKYLHPHSDFMSGSFANWTCIGAAETPNERLDVAVVTGMIIAKKGKIKLPKENALDMEPVHGR